MDSSDDFEMKPLTTGLGFQKRQVQLKEQMAKSGVAQNSLRRSLPSEPAPEMLGGLKPRTAKEIIDELHAALTPIEKPTSKEKPLAKENASALQMTGVLPRDIHDLPRPEITPLITPIENINFQITDKIITPKSGPRRGAHDNLIKPLSPISVSFAAMLLDSAIVFALTLIFLVSLVVVTGVDVLSVVRSSQTEFATQLSMLVLFLAVYEMYIIVSRSFFGKTTAEWTFDLQMGDDEQMEKTIYPAQVLWRSLLNFFTGIIFLPLLSFLFKRDIAAKYTGLQLYRKNL